MRARDALGRPVPDGSPEAVEPEPEESLPPADAVVRARGLLAQGRAFAAHEVCEAVWKVARDEVWKGLAQLLAGVVHAQRGNAVGCARLLQRAAMTLAGHRSDVVDVEALRGWALAAASAPERVRAGDVPL